MALEPFDLLKIVYITASENPPVLVFLVFAGSFILAALNAIYFHYRHQRDLDQLVMKEQYIDGGLLFNLMRLMLYGHYCLFPKGAQRDGVYEIFSTLPCSIRVHLIFHWCVVIFSLFLMPLSYLLSNRLDF